MSGLKEFGESAAQSVLERIGRGVGRVQERKPLPNDVLESDDAYLVVFDAPGVQRSDVQVRFLDGEVQVQIDRFRDFHEGFEMRFPGRGLSLDGSAKLPDDAAVDATGASATIAANGTLRVEIPKDEHAQDVAVTDEADASSSDADATGTGAAGDETTMGETMARESSTREGSRRDDARDDTEGETSRDEIDAPEDGAGLDATGSSTNIDATDAADGVGSTDSTDIDDEDDDNEDDEDGDDGDSNSAGLDR